MSQPKLQLLLMVGTRSDPQVNEKPSCKPRRLFSFYPVIPQGLASITAAAISWPSETVQKSSGGLGGMIWRSGPDFLRSWLLRRFGLGAVGTSRSVELRTSFDPAKHDVFQSPPPASSTESPFRPVSRSKQALRNSEALFAAFSPLHEVFHHPRWPLLRSPGTLVALHQPKPRRGNSPAFGRRTNGRSPRRWHRQTSR